MNPNGSEAVDISGRQYGRLIVIRRFGTDVSPNGSPYPTWLCRCDCGNEVIVRGCSLKRGHTRSCGCYRRDASRKAAQEGRYEKHGFTKAGHKERLYGIWSQMVQRATNPACKDFEAYGGRGIGVCDEWRSDYKAFRRWALENGYDATAPFSKCTIDRIDNDKGYSPDNCRWVDMKVQNNNKKREATMK